MLVLLLCSSSHYMITHIMSPTPAAATRMPYSTTLTIRNDSWRSQLNKVAQFEQETRTHNWLEISGVINTHIREDLRIDHSLWPFTLTIHSDHSHWPFTLIIHSDHSNWPFTLTIHSDHSLWPFTLTIHTDHSLWSFTLTIHADHSCWPFTLTIHTDHSHWPFTLTIHTDHSLWPFTLTIQANHWRGPFTLTAQPTTRGSFDWLKSLRQYEDITENTAQ